MTLDRHAAERRRFARLLGVDGQHGCGLPIGAGSSGTGDDAGGAGGRDGRSRADGDDSGPTPDAERPDEDVREPDDDGTEPRLRRARRR